MLLKMARDATRFYQQYHFTFKDVLPLPIVTNENAMKEYELMELREDDLFVVTYPKSGTHWMQEIVQLILVNGHVERLTAKERRPVIELADIRSHDPELVAAAGPVLREMKDAPSPRVLTSHVQYSFLPKQFQEKRPKTIYIYRHPKDVLISLFNFYLSFIRQDVEPAPFEDFVDDFIAGQVVFGSWFDHVNDYYRHKDEDNFFALPFEAMKQDLHKVVQDVSSFIGKSLDEATIQSVVEGASFETMKKSFQKDHEKNTAERKDVMPANAFVHKGKVGQWKDLLNPVQNKLLDELFREKMKDCDWTRPYAPDLPNV